MLDSGQQTKATAVYGSSLDFSSIFISNKTGLGGRPFTIAFPDQSDIVQIMNCGTFSPSDATLIHELAHVWQSQHHSNKFQFMANAVKSQSLAAASNAAAAITDPLVALNKDFPLFYPFDAYSYDSTSMSFGSMAAEQMASAIENGEKTIVAHAKSIGMNAVDPLCVSGLSAARFADRRLPGVK
jgi:Zn-dependent peptidase ImmA (M78 family)